MQATVLLLLLGLVIPYWYCMVKRIEKHVNLTSQNLHSQLQSQIEKTTKLFNLTSSSTPNLAALLNSSLNGSILSFLEIENEVGAYTLQFCLISTFQNHVVNSIYLFHSILKIQISVIIL